MQSHLSIQSTLLRDHLSIVATITGTLEPNYSENEPVLRR